MYYWVIILDNLSNSKETVIEVIRKLTDKNIKFYKVDMKNFHELSKVFAENKIESVIHFAGYKAVDESVKLTLKYYENNLMSTINLLKVMEMYNVNNIVFSSSATVYGANNQPPFSEDMSTAAIDPYGFSKVMIEQILKDAHNANKNLSVCILRYFNPIGADESGDLPATFANPAKALEELDWKAEKILYDMCKDAWRW